MLDKSWRTFWAPIVLPFALGAILYIAGRGHAVPSDGQGGQTDRLTPTVSANATGTAVAITPAVSVASSPAEATATHTLSAKPKPSADAGSTPLQPTVSLPLASGGASSSKDVQTATTTDPGLARAKADERNGDVDSAQALYRQLAQSANGDVADEAQFQFGRSLLASGNSVAAVDAFQTYTKRFPNGDHVADATFVLAWYARQQGQAQESVTLFTNYLRMVPDGPLSGYAYYWIGDVQRSAGNSAAAAKLFEKAATIGLPPDLDRDAVDFVGSYDVNAGQLAAAVQWYADQAERAQSNLSLHGHFLLRLANAQERQGQHAQAIASYRAAVGGAAPGVDVGTAVNALIRLNTPVSSFDAGIAFLKAKQYALAVRAFGDDIDASPTAPNVGEARYQRAIALVGDGQMTDGIAQLDKLIAQGPTQARFSDAWILKAETQRKAGNTAAAVSTLMAFVKAAPRDPQAADALWQAGRLVEANSGLDAAVPVYQQIQQQYPESSYAPQAAFREGWAAYEALDFARANQIWANVAQRWPTSPGSISSLLWLGKMQARSGDVVAAKKTWAMAWNAFPGDYYAFRARDLAQSTANDATVAVLATPSAAKLQQERQDMVRWLATWARPGQEDPTRDDLNAHVVRDGVTARVDQLLALGLRDQALSEIHSAESVYAADGPSLFILADDLAKTNLTSDALKIAYQLLMLSPAPNAYQSPIYLQRLVYPTPYLSLVEASARQNGVDPLLLYALMRQESTFNPNAQSSVGAVGLTQFMPGTAAGVAARLGMNGFQLSDLLRPRVAIELGAAYLAAEIKALAGNPYFALASYNAGAGNVTQWLQDNPRRDVDLFVEEIPFHETRSYVMNVFRFYEEYRLLYSGGSAG